MASLKHLDDAARKAGLRAVRTTRDSSTHTFSLYLDAAVATHFLRSDGQDILKAADACSQRLMQAAVKNHKVSDGGSQFAYAWGAIRKLHPTGPSAVHLWGRHAPPADSDRALPTPCHALQTEIEQ